LDLNGGTFGLGGGEEGGGAAASVLKCGETVVMYGSDDGPDGAGREV